MNTLGERIKFYRKKNNLSQELLADKMNVSQSTIAKWETGVQFPRSKNIKLLAKILNTTSLKLLDDFSLEDSDEVHITVGTHTMTLKKDGKELVLPYDKEKSIEIIKEFFSGEKAIATENENSGISIKQENVGRDAIANVQ